MNPMLTRYRALLGWTVLACLIAGLYGMLHNQVSYTVSPDYFHAFKFHQFRFPEALRHRGGASLVGFLASWWTGLAIGPVLFMTYHRRLQSCPPARMMLRGFGLTLLITAGVGAAGLGLGVLFVSPELARLAPPDALDPLAFVRSGMMHDCSYFGGVVGTVIAALIVRPPATHQERKTEPTDVVR